MNPETIDRIIEELGPIADKLGQSAEHLYRVSARQALIEGATSLIGALVAAAVAVVAVKLAFWCRREFVAVKEAKGSYSMDGDGYLYGGICAAFVALVAVIPFSALLTEGIHYLLNPEYRAIRLMFEALGIG